MRITNISTHETTYTCNVYYIRGDWNSLDNVNTLIDVGRDKEILNSLLLYSGGVGKCRVEQVILTHSHFDHAGLLNSIRQEFNPRVCAFSPFLAGVDHYLSDREVLQAGDGKLEVIYTPGHSNDSVCLLAAEEGVLFAGDAPIIVRSGDETYEKGFLTAMERICAHEIKTVYFGHGNPMTERCNEHLQDSLRIVRQNVR
ncbi:MAG: MBL fold metallo-hydrolase [Methanomicrobiales archaeon]|nr:MBL fold metallo-hydrolase [Methanomicrobiales archaeon]